MTAESWGGINKQWIKRRKVQKQVDRHEQVAEKLLTVNKAVNRSHQSVPKTHVPVRSHMRKKTWIKHIRTRKANIPSHQAAQTTKGTHIPFFFFKSHSLIGEAYCWCSQLRLQSHDVRIKKKKPCTLQQVFSTLTCCLSIDPQWQWARRSPQRQSHELSCCGTARSARVKAGRLLATVAVIEKQTKMETTGSTREDTNKVRGKNRNQSAGESRGTSAGCLPGTVWVCSHLCWSARDSTRHQHQRCQTVTHQTTTFMHTWLENRKAAVLFTSV